MAWNGAGVFNRLFSWTADKAAAIDITASRVDSDTNDIVTQGLGNCITRDGQGQPTANLPMATFRHTGVANGVARTDYAAMGQLEDGTVNWAAAGGSADAIAATYIPALTALVDGQLCWVRAVAANATTTPTFSPNGLPVHTITKIGGAPLAAADINATGHEIILRYNLANTRWELLNPAAPILYSNDAGAGVGPTLDLFRDSASPAASDVIGSVDLNGRDSGGAKQLYARITAQINTATAAAEDAGIYFQQVIAGAFSNVLFSSSTAWTTGLKLALTNSVAAFLLTGGATGSRNGSPTAGETRYNTTLNGLEYWNGTAWIVGGQKPTVQRFLSGSGNYTTPANVLYIKVTMCGPGAGGAASTTNNGTNGTANTSFGSWTAVLGQGGVTSNGAGGIGGTGGTDVADASNKLIDRVSGGVGAGGGTSGTAGVVPFAGSGGNNPRGGAGAGGKSGTAGTNAAANSGGGGGGGGANAGAQGGGGGGAGEWVQFYVYPTAAQVIAYVVGAAGAGGIAGVNAGGNGAAGIIVVEEFYS